MACGDRYSFLAVTASGLSFENPYDDVPTFDDLEEWKELARQLALLARSYANILGEVEGAATPGSFPRWNRVNRRLDRAVGLYDELPDLFSGSVPVDIAKAQSSVRESLCALELAIDSIIALGGDAPDVPGGNPPRENDDVLPSIGTGAGVVIGLAVVVLLVGVMRR